MINTPIEVKPKGHVIIHVGSKEVYNNHNAILSNSKEIIARCIGGYSAFKLDTVWLYKAGVLLATSITPIIPTFPALNKVRLSYIFPADSFDDTLDEIRLGSLAGGEFSAIGDLSITKSDIENMSIQWTIEIV